jgi:hypothetical protein
MITFSFKGGETQEEKNGNQELARLCCKVQLEGNMVPLKLKKEKWSNNKEKCMHVHKR